MFQLYLVLSVLFIVLKHTKSLNILKQNIWKAEPTVSYLLIIGPVPVSESLQTQQFRPVNQPPAQPQQASRSAFSGRGYTWGNA